MRKRNGLRPRLDHLQLEKQVVDIEEGLRRESAAWAQAQADLEAESQQAALRASDDRRKAGLVVPSFAEDDHVAPYR